MHVRAIVAQFTDTTGFGGAERMLLALLTGLDRQRWRPVLLHYDNPSAQRLAAEAQRIGVEARVVPTRTERASAPDLIQLVRMLRAERAAVLHAHLSWPLRCTRALCAARLARVSAVIATQHLFADLPGRRAALKHRLVATGVDRYIAVSHEMQRAMQRVVPRHKLAVIPNGIPLHDFARRRDPALRRALLGADAQSLVLTVARLDWQKGLDLLLRAAALVPTARFAIAGDGTDRARLEQLAVELGVAERVTFLGERADVADLLASADVFVLPSVLEGLPLAVLEAMAAGVPVVGTDVPGTREAIRHDDSGLLIPPGDAPSLARAIQSLIDAPDRAGRLVAAARRRLARDFSIETTVGRVTGLYEETLARAPRPHACC
jgi:glycosyltransferase involved in cell wall biosynthesis